MEDKRNLDDLIKSSFDKINKGAPDGLWGKLSSALDTESPDSTENDPVQNSLDTKVKESFSSLNRRAPKHVWAAINRQLNIERVWEGISTELNNTQPFYWPKIRKAAAVLLLLLLSTGIYISISKNAVDPGVAAGQDKEVRRNGDSFIAFDSGEDTEGGKELKEQKAGTLNQPAIREQGTYYSEKRATASGNSGEGEQEKVFAEERSAVHRKRAFPKSKEAENNVDTTESPSFLIKEEANLPNFVKENSPEAKKLPDNHTFAREATKELNERASHVTDQRMGAVALEDTNGLSRGRLSMDQILSQKVNSLPITPDEINIHDILETISSDTLPLQQIARELPHDKKEGKLVDIRNFEAGPVWVYHNSWLLNNETRNSFDENSLISTDPAYKQNWGLSFNYNLSGKSALATEIHLLSKAGQQYRMYEEGEYLKKKLELRYHKIYLQYQRQFLERGKGMPGWFTIKAGVYGGILQNKLGEIRQEESRYAGFDYGFRLAAGQEHKLGRIIIGYGLSSERGLNNVFRGTEKLPAAFNKTYIQNYGTYLNVMYAF